MSAVTRPTSSSSSPYLVLDELFHRSVQAECRSVPMAPMEIVMVLEALECALLQPHDVLAAHFAAPERDALLSVPLNNAPALAAFLNAFSQEHRVTAATVSLPAAERATARMLALVTQPYEAGSARQALFSLCCGYTTLVSTPQTSPSSPPYSSSSSSSSSSSCVSPSASLPPFSPPALTSAQQRRPSLWPAKAVRLLCESLSLPLRAGGGDAASLAAATGLSLLSTEPPEARAAFGIRPSLLLLRYAVYRHVLVLLEQWWGEGDTAGWALAPWCPCPAGLDSRGAGDSSAASSAPAAVAPAEAVPVVRQVAGFTALERGLASMSRAHAWGLSLLHCAVIAAHIAGAQGAILPAPGLPREAKAKGQGRKGKGPTERTAGGAEGGCSWVALAVRPLCEAGAGVGGSEWRLVLGSNYPCIKPCSPTDPAAALARSLVPALPSSASSLSASAPAPALLSFLLPTDCLHPPSTAPAAPALSPHSVSVGAAVLVAPSADLAESCGRYEWWDCPGQARLAAMAGRRGVVVSVSGVELEKYRVGVCVESEDDDGCPLDIIDALPLDCLRPLARKEQREEGRRRRRRKKRAREREVEEGRKLAEKEERKKREEELEGKRQREEEAEKEAKRERARQRRAERAGGSLDLQEEPGAVVVTGSHDVSAAAAPSAALEPSAPTRHALALALARGAAEAVVGAATAAAGAVASVAGGGSGGGEGGVVRRPLYRPLDVDPPSAPHAAPVPTPAPTPAPTPTPVPAAPSGLVITPHPSPASVLAAAASAPRPASAAASHAVPLEVKDARKQRPATAERDGAARREREERLAGLRVSGSGAGAAGAAVAVAGVKTRGVRLTAAAAAAAAAAVEGGESSEADIPPSPSPAAEAAAPAAAPSILAESEEGYDEEKGEAGEERWEVEEADQGKTEGEEGAGEEEEEEAVAAPRSLPSPRFHLDVYAKELSPFRQGGRGSRGDEGVGAAAGEANREMDRERSDIDIGVGGNNSLPLSPRAPSDVLPPALSPERMAALAVLRAAGLQLPAAPLPRIPELVVPPTINVRIATIDTATAASGVDEMASPRPLQPGYAWLRPASRARALASLPSSSALPANLAAHLPSTSAAGAGAGAVPGMRLSFHAAPALAAAGIRVTHYGQPAGASRAAAPADKRGPVRYLPYAFSYGQGPGQGRGQGPNQGQGRAGWSDGIVGGALCVSPRRGGGQAASLAEDKQDEAAGEKRQEGGMAADAERDWAGFHDDESGRQSLQPVTVTASLALGWEQQRQQHVQQQLQQQQQQQQHQQEEEEDEERAGYPGFADYYLRLSHDEHEGSLAGSQEGWPAEGGEGGGVDLDGGSVASALTAPIIGTEGGASFARGLLPLPLRGDAGTDPYPRTGTASAAAGRAGWGGESDAFGVYMGGRGNSKDALASTNSAINSTSTGRGRGEGGVAGASLGAGTRGVLQRPWHRPAALVALTELYPLSAAGLVSAAGAAAADSAPSRPLLTASLGPDTTWTNPADIPGRGSAASPFASPVSSPRQSAAHRKRSPGKGPGGLTVVSASTPTKGQGQGQGQAQRAADWADLNLSPERSPERTPALTPAASWDQLGAAGRGREGGAVAVPALTPLDGGSFAVRGVRVGAGEGGGGNTGLATAIGAIMGVVRTGPPTTDAAAEGTLQRAATAPTTSPSSSAAAANPQPPLTRPHGEQVDAAQRQLDHLWRMFEQQGAPHLGASPSRAGRGLLMDGDASGRGDGAGLDGGEPLPLDSTERQALSAMFVRPPSQPADAAQDPRLVQRNRDRFVLDREARARREEEREREVRWRRDVLLGLGRPAKSSLTGAVARLVEEAAGVEEVGRSLPTAVPLSPSARPGSRGLHLRAAKGETAAMRRARQQREREREQQEAEIEAEGAAAGFLVRADVKEGTEGRETVLTIVLPGDTTERERRREERRARRREREEEEASSNHSPPQREFVASLASPAAASRSGPQAGMPRVSFRSLSALPHADRAPLLDDTAPCLANTYTDVDAFNLASGSLVDATAAAATRPAASSASLRTFDSFHTTHTAYTEATLGTDGSSLPADNLLAALADPGERRARALALSRSVLDLGEGEERARDPDSPAGQHTGTGYSHLNQVTRAIGLANTAYAHISSRPFYAGEEEHDDGDGSRSPGSPGGPLSLSSPTPNAHVPQPNPLFRLGTPEAIRQHLQEEQLREDGYKRRLKLREDKERAAEAAALEKQLRASLREERRRQAEAERAGEAPEGLGDGVVGVGTAGAGGGSLSARSGGSWSSQGSRRSRGAAAGSM